MEAFEALMTRHSVRAYTDEPVSEEQLRKILAAGMQAPSASNQQPWHFIVVRGRAELASLSGVLPFGKMVAQAAAALVVCADVGNIPWPLHWPMDCSAATQNILLACHAMGLGAVWIGCYPNEERMAALRGLLGIPDSVTPLCTVAIGHPAEPPRQADRFRPDRIHQGKW